MIELRPIIEENLFFQAISKFALGLIGIALLLFFPAGTFHYWNGWLLIAILFVPMFFAGIVMMLRDPERLKKRLNAKEDEADPKRGSGFDAGAGGISGVPGKGSIQGDPVHLVKQVRIQRRS